MLEKLFNGDCSSSAGAWAWAPCATTSGLARPGAPMFIDFPANVLGSFLIGSLTAGSALPTLFPQLGAAGAAVVKPLQLLFLPRDWSLQSHAALHIGMRTGYCGSLTTFSSWILQARPGQRAAGEGEGLGRSKERTGSFRTAPP